MKVRWFSWFSWLVASWCSFSFFFLLYVSSWVFPGFSCGVSGFVSPFICFDMVSFYLLVLTVVLSFCVIVLVPWLSLEVVCLVLVSQFFSMLCYVCCHVLFFWFFYEMSIVPLLYLLVKHSPYSERYTAFWYFLGYVVFCSLPMLLVFIYYSLLFGSFSVLSWDVKINSDWWVLLLISVLFITKIPLFPFHSWLPLVHAEASSVVSICLSGYVMKLGILGVFRFGWWVIPEFLFSDFYVSLVLFSGSVFLVCSSFELDMKRWLAFLSLSHITLAPVIFCVSSDYEFDVSFNYCLGHGLSSCVTFVLFWFMSLAGKSRNTLVLKHLFSSSFISESGTLGCFCLCASFPTSIQFFCEVFAVCYSGNNSLVLCFLCLYLFLSALVVFISFGFVVIRSRSVFPLSSVSLGPLSVIVFLCVINFSCFLIF